MRQFLIIVLAFFASLAILTYVPEPWLSWARVLFPVALLLWLGVASWISWSVRAGLKALGQIDPGHGFIARAVRDGARRILAESYRGDEITLLARQLGLGDPWLAPEPWRGFVPLGEVLAPGQTERMLLMALLSIERDVPVVIVGADQRHVDQIRERMKYLILSRRWGLHVTMARDLLHVYTGRPGNVEVRFTNVRNLVQHTIGRLNFDLYIDHAVWDRSTCEVQVELTSNGPVCHVITDHGLGYVQGWPLDPVRYAEARRAAVQAPKSFVEGAMRTVRERVWTVQTGRQLGKTAQARVVLGDVPLGRDHVHAARICTVTVSRLEKSYRQVAACVRWARRNPSKRCVVVVSAGQERHVASLFAEDWSSDILRTKKSGAAFALTMSSGAVIEITAATPEV